MTYNFDPDRWYDDQVRVLEMRRAAGEINETAVAAAIADLERRYQAMVARLEGTYQLNLGSPAPSGGRSS